MPTPAPPSTNSPLRFGLSRALWTSTQDIQLKILANSTVVLRSLAKHGAETTLLTLLYSYRFAARVSPVATSSDKPADRYVRQQQQANLKPR